MSLVATHTKEKQFVRLVSDSIGGKPLWERELMREGKENKQNMPTMHHAHWPLLVVTSGNRLPHQKACCRRRACRVLLFSRRGSSAGEASFVLRPLWGRFKTKYSRWSPWPQHYIFWRPVRKDSVRDNRSKMKGATEVLQEHLIEVREVFTTVRHFSS